MTETEIPNNLMGKKFIELAFNHCIKCSTCKYSYKEFTISCPSGEKHLFESFWASGRIRTTRGLILGDLEWDEDIKDVIFACPTCGACMDACQAPHADFIVDIIESLREMAVKEIGPANNQKKLIERATNPDMWNPYGEPNSNNNDLKNEYSLPDKAEWVYFIGCTSNYRQKNLRDATLRFLKKAKIDFTLIDEHCCTSPMLRTGQVEECRDFMNYNIKRIKETGASKVITSCAGCYRTLKKDFEKFGIDYDFEVVHTAELIKDLIEDNRIEFKSDFKKKVTYHDPCHLGRHMGIYEIPRKVYQSIPGLELVEMERNRNHSWCCGAGGGVKIGYPDWSLEISEKRLREARETEAAILSSTCPFCKTNLSDANEKFNFGFEVLDLIEIIDGLEYKIRSK